MPIVKKDIVSARVALESKLKEQFPSTLLTFHTIHSDSLTHFPNIMVGVESRGRQMYFGIVVRRTRPLKASLSGTLHQGRQQGIRVFVMYRIAPDQWEFMPDLIDTLWEFIKQTE